MKILFVIHKVNKFAKFRVLQASVFFFLLGLLLVIFLPLTATNPGAGNVAKTSGPEPAIFFVCAMHPNVQQNNPGVCPICGMPLIAVTKDANGFSPVNFAPTVRADVQTLSTPQMGTTINGILKLSDLKGTPVTFDDLKLTHTKRIHLLIVDDSLSDYTHVHPTETGVPGEYAFTFQPKHGGHYNFIADLLPLATGRQEYARAGLTVLGDPAPPYRWVNQSARVNGYWFYLQTDQDRGFVVGEPTSVKVIVTDSRGAGVTCLEPLMAAFAHGVAFSSDLSTVLHVHPIGPIPSSTDRGGPFLEFKVVPRTAGYMKFYVQVQINNDNVYASFGIKVRPPGEKFVFQPAPSCD